MPHSDSPRTFGAIIVPCTARKTVESPADLVAENLTVSDLEGVGAAWRATLKQSSRVAIASNLYAGSAIRVGKQMAARCDARLYIVSAGLGLISGDTSIPAYNLTVADSGRAGIRRRIRGAFSASAWWDQVKAGPFAVGWQELTRNSRGRCVLIAVSKPYAEMIGQDLAALPMSIRRRLRIFGAGIEKSLPENLGKYVMPYDARLDQLAPGIKADFAIRSLTHFAMNCKPSDSPARDLTADHDWVATTMQGLAPVRPVQRERISDEELILVTRRLSRLTSSTAVALRIFRREYGLAAEQSRFNRAFNQVIR